MHPLAVNLMNYSFDPSMLADARKAKKLTQAELGEAIGVHRNTIAAWESQSDDREPTRTALEAIAVKLGVDLSCFFSDRSKQTGVSIDLDRDDNATNEALEALVSSALKKDKLTNQLIQMLTSSENPLDYDRFLWDRHLDELQQVTPGALHWARDRLALSIADVSRMTGLSSSRITDLELKQGLPAMPEEIMTLRKALGVAYEPRAVAFSGLSLQPIKDKRPAKVKLEESVRIWQTECKRTPNKLDLIIAKLDQLQRDVEELKRGKNT